MGALQRVMAFADAKSIDLEVDWISSKADVRFCAGTEARVRMRAKADVRRPPCICGFTPWTDAGYLAVSVCGTPRRSLIGTQLFFRR